MNIFVQAGSFLSSHLFYLIRGWSDVSKSLFLYLENLVSDDEILRNCFWNSLHNELQLNDYGGVNLNVSVNAPLIEQDQAYANSWYLSVDREYTAELGYRAMYRLVIEASYYDKEVVLCESYKHEVEVFDKDNFLQLYKRLLE